MVLRIAQVPNKQQLEKCIDFQVWGAKRFIFKDWKLGDYLAFKIGNGDNSRIEALAKVSGKYYSEESQVWEDDIYPHRIPIKFIHRVS